MKQRSKIFGSILIVSGTTIGAGMLALPLTTMTLGLIPSFYLLVGVWAYMLFTALITLKVSLTFPLGSTFHTMAREVLGPKGWWITTISILWLFYALLAAYTAGATSFLKIYLPLPSEVTSILFMGIFALIIGWSTKAIDFTNRLLFFGQCLAFLAIGWMAMPHIQLDPSDACDSCTWHAFAVAIPIFITSFGFHGSIPSLVSYLKKDQKALRTVFIIGSLLPLFAYSAWQLMTLGVLPPNASTEVMSVDALVRKMSTVLQTPTFKVAIEGFAQLAILTSFLGVGMGLKNFFQDMLARSKCHRRRWVLLFTFTPPLLIVLISPQIFVRALGFAAIALIILAVMIPLSIALIQHRRALLRLSFLERTSIYAAFVIGGLLILLEATNLMGGISA